MVEWLRHPVKNCFCRPFIEAFPIRACIIIALSFAIGFAAVHVAQPEVRLNAAEAADSR